MSLFKESPAADLGPVLDLVPGADETNDLADEGLMAVRIVGERVSVEFRDIVVGVEGGKRPGSAVAVTERGMLFEVAVESRVDAERLLDRELSATEVMLGFLPAGSDVVLGWSGSEEERRELEDEGSNKKDVDELYWVVSLCIS